MPEAVALHAKTVELFAIRDTARDKLMAAVALGNTDGYDQYPYRGVAGDQYGFPASDTLAADNIRAIKLAQQDPLSWSKEHAISAGIQFALLEGFKRDLQDRRLRKGQRLQRWRTDMIQDKTKRAILVSNIAGETARRKRD